MTSSSRQTLPAINSETGWCPNCKLFVGFTLEHHVRVHPEWESDRVPSRSLAKGAKNPTRDWLAVWSCQVCKQTITVIERRERIGDGWSDAARRLVHPAPQARLLDTSIPDTVRSIFQEGTTAEQAGALRAAAAMYRATVEELCADKGATGPNLKAKIANLKDFGLASDLIDDLDEARLLGNWSLHQGVTFSSDEVSDVAALIEEALFEVYVQPAQRQAMRAARRARRDANPRT